jgi:hypothetical protein
MGGGSELLTLFSTLPGDPERSEVRKIPILSVLRDTMGDDDSDNDRLRYVWLLVDEKQSAPARWLTTEPDLGEMPRPLVDLSAPASGIFKAILRNMLQVMLLDPGGAGTRIPSRSYLSSQAASRTVRLFEATTIMVRMLDSTDPALLERQDYERILARLILADRSFGGLVRDGSLERVVERELGGRRQALGRNWELLRQRAETEGLIFQPIGPEGGPAVAAILWVSRADLELKHRRAFRSEFLAIADPWNDGALRQWRGYTETWRFDSEGRRTTDEATAVHSEEVIPLAMYSLDHPKAPFLLIDFRSPWKPMFREAARRGVEEIPRTVLGFTAFTNVELRAAEFAWNSIRSRRGAAIHRPSRLRAAASVRQMILSSPQLEPEMRMKLTMRLGTAAPSSFRRYESLLAWALSTNGERRIREDRGRELAKLMHPRRTRWLNLATVATAGLYKYRVSISPDRLVLLDRERRLEKAAAVLEAAISSNSGLDPGADVARIREAAGYLARVRSLNQSAEKRAVRLLMRLSEQHLGDDFRVELGSHLKAAGEEKIQKAVLEGGGID